jgi:hypothetical protein
MIVSANEDCQALRQGASPCQYSDSQLPFPLSIVSFLICISDLTTQLRDDHQMIRHSSQTTETVDDEEERRGSRSSRDGSTVEKTAY